MTKFTSILLYVAAVSAAAIRDIGCTSGPISANGRQCTVECGVDHNGGDYTSQYTADLQTCIDACTSDSKCETAQYLTTNSYCYLKNSVNPGSNNTLVNGVNCQTASEVETCKPGRVTVGGRTGTVECGSDHPGGDYAAKYTGTLSACEEACAADTQCLTAQFDSNSLYCYLKNAVADAVAKANVNGIVFDASAPYSNSTISH